MCSITFSYTAVNGGGITRFGYAGDQMIAEYDAGGNLVRRHVPSTGSDERGSIVATADNAGNVSQIMTYYEFGIPGGNCASRFQYTGQALVARTRHGPLQSPDLLADPRALHAARPHRPRRRHEPLQLCRR